MSSPVLRTLVAFTLPVAAWAQESVWARSDVTGHWYGFPSQTTSWAEGEAAAVALGGHLASLESAAETAWIQGRFADYALVNYWIGLNDTVVEGAFEWTSAEPFSYTNWGVEQPNDATGNDDAVEVRPTDGWRWFDSFGANSVSRKPLMETVGVPRYGWSLPELHSVDGGPKRVVTGQFDANPALDVATIGEASIGVVNVLFGNGAGAFAPLVTFTPGTYLTGLAAADFDADGIDDLAVSSNSGALVYLADGAGGFTLGPSIAFAPAVTDLAAADFNGDGRPDLAVTVWPATGGALAVALADATGGFLPPVTSTFSGRGWKVTAGRIDSGPSIDLLVNTVFYPFRMQVFLNDGAGAFSATPLDANSNVNGRPALADLDGDGNTDLAIPAGFPEGVDLAFGDGTGAFVYGPRLATARVPLSVAQIDVDGDGWIDLAVTGRDDDVVAIHKNRGGTFLPHEVLPALVDAPAVLAVGDLDGDARTDLVVGAQSAARVAVLRKLSRDCNGNGRDDPRDIELGASLDLDGDGEPDECQTAGTGFCFGDGTATTCPCGPGQAGDAGTGCRNSTGTSGRLEASGNPSATLDSITLRSSGVPASTVGLLFQGEQPVNGGSGALFGDGLRCVHQNVIRLFVRSATDGSIDFGSGVALDPEISDVGQVPALGATRVYQLWYRDAQSYCTSATWNLTNGVSIAWGP